MRPTIVGTVKQRAPSGLRTSPAFRKRMNRIFNVLQSVGMDDDVESAVGIRERVKVNFGICAENVAPEGFQHGSQRSGFVDFEKSEVFRRRGSGGVAQARLRAEECPQRIRQRDGPEVRAAIVARLALLTVDIVGFGRGNLPFVDQLVPQYAAKSKTGSPADSALNFGRSHELFLSKLCM